jgi:hypothetical protein
MPSLLRRYWVVGVGECSQGPVTDVVRQREAITEALPRLADEGHAAVIRFRRP